VSVPYADRTVTEITCHGKGAEYLFHQDGIVIDIGGQDTKGIAIKNGKVMKFLMNDKCSAGTGKFLEVMTNRLGLTQAELSQMAAAGQPTTISSMCTVFAESEVISLIGLGTPREDIAYGVIDSVVRKVAQLIGQIPGDTYMLTGGLCEESYLQMRLGEVLHGPVVSTPMARYAGAIGAALFAMEGNK
jgi:predicted CoA-substrate-specific enzyme activase